MSPDMIDAMIAAGLTREQMAALLKHELAKQEKAKAEKRAADAARQRKSRLSRSVTVTACDIDGQSVTERAPYTEDARTYAEPEPTNTTNKGKNDILTDISKIPAEKPDVGFDPVWDAYPRRQGGNSRKNAEARYRKAVRAGVDPEAILAGVRAYAAHCDATGKTGTEFVKTAEAWLNGQLWESDWSISLSRPGPPHRQANNRRSLADALHRILPDEPPEQPSYPRLAFGG
jgi:hypothetical protein